MKRWFAVLVALFVGMSMGTAPADSGLQRRVAELEEIVWSGDQPAIRLGSGKIRAQTAAAPNTDQGLFIKGARWIRLQTGDTRAYLTQDKLTVNAPLQIEAVTLYMEGEDLWAESQGEQVLLIDFP